MQPYAVPVRKTTTPVNPIPLTNRFNHLYLNHNLSYETMRQHQARKNTVCREEANSPAKYWDLRKEASLNNAQIQWTVAKQDNLCTEPTLPWVSGKELAENRRSNSRGTTLGQPVGVVLPAKFGRITANPKDDQSSNEPALHLMNPQALRLAHSLSPAGDRFASLNVGGGGGGGGNGGYGNSNAVQQVFGIWKAARTKIGGLIGILIISTFIIMLLFSLLFFVSKSIGLYTTVGSFGLSDYLWFSMRSFVTMSSPDLGPVNGFGRMLANAEGLLGLVVVIILSYFIGDKMKRWVGGD